MGSIIQLLHEDIRRIRLEHANGERGREISALRTGNLYVLSNGMSAISRECKVRFFLNSPKLCFVLPRHP